MKEKPYILVADDDPNISRLVALYLEKENFQVKTVARGDDAVNEFHRLPPDLMLLDVMLPGMDGYQVLKAVRKSGEIPVIMLTARDETFDKVLGLELGADDYIEKPYDIDILIAKIKGIFRRRLAMDTISDGGIVLNLSEGTAEKDGTPLNLTAKEFELLHLLIANKGQTLGKELIFSRIWGADSESEPQTLTVHIKWLRQKIEKDPKVPEKIITVWGKGYRWEG